jgi:hypothetical protein
MNSYLIYKIIQSQKARPKYLGFQLSAQKRDSLTKNKTESSSKKKINYKKVSLCSLEAMNEMNRSSTPSLFSKQSIIKAKNSMPKNFCDLFKCNNNNKKVKKPLRKYSSIKTKSTTIMDRGMKLQNDRKSSQIATYSNVEKIISAKGVASSVTKIDTLNKCSSLSRPLTHLSAFSTTKALLENEKKIHRISVNRISHYITIIVLGFYFILSTIPYGVMLSLQNNSTLKLNYYLEPCEIYTDKLWLRYGLYRQLVAFTKLFFISNHCLNFFVYLLFNRMFRHVFKNSIFSIFSFFKFINVNIKKDYFDHNNQLNYRHCSSKKANLDKNYN